MLEDHAKKLSRVTLDSILYQLLQLSAIQTGQLLCHRCIDTNLADAFTQ